MKVVLLTLFVCIASYMMQAQSLRVMPVSSDDISDEAAMMLYNRLNQAVSLNGMASTDNSNKFLLIPSVTVVSVEATATAPINYVAELEIAIYIVDNSKKLLLSQETLVKKGVGDNEKNAVMEAVKLVKSRDPKLKKIITIAKDRIVDYYNDECESVIATINSYIDAGLYDMAIDELNAIPQIDAELDCYKKTIEILNKIPVEQQSKSNNNIKNDNPDVTWIK